MAHSKNVVIRNAAGDIETGLLVTLRDYTDNFTAVKFTAVEVVGKEGTYQFTDVVYSRYKLYKGGVEDKSWGGDNGQWWGGQLGDVFLKVDGSNKMTGDFDADDHFIKNAKDPTDDSHVGDYGFNKSKFAQKTADNIFTGTNTFNGIVGFGQNVIFQNTRTIDMAGAAFINCRNPVNLQDPANKQWTLQQINAIAGYYESITSCRLLQGETEQAGKIYSSWGAAMAYLKTIKDTFPSAECVLKVDSAGTDSVHIPIAVGEFQVSEFEDGIHIKGIGQHVLLDIASVAEYVVTAGKVKIENIGLCYNNPTKTGLMDGFIFQNCYFEVTAGTLKLQNCFFRGVNMFKNSGGQLQLINCKGVKVYCTQLPAISGTHLMEVSVDADLF